MTVRTWLLSALVCFGSGAFAQELPPPAELQAKVSEMLPGYWIIVEFRTIATSDIGDAAQPRRAVRFEADAAPTAPLFAQASTEGPYVLVVPTGSTDAPRTIYGVLDLSYKAGTWSGAANIENPVEGLGQPLTLFNSPTLELGSEEADQRLAALRDQSLNASIAAMEREIAAKQAEQVKAMAALEAANANELMQAQSSRAKLIAETETRLAEELAALEAKYRTALAELTTTNEPLVAEAKAERERLLAAEKATAAAALKAQRDAAAVDLEALTAEHARVRGALIAKQNQEMAQLETGLATERRSLERQVDAAQEVIALQKTLTAALAERQVGAEALMAAFDVARKEKQEFFARLPQVWRGTMSCADTAGRGLVNKSYTADLSITSVRSEGFSAEIELDSGSERQSEFIISDANFSFPLQFEVTWRVPNAKTDFGFQNFPMEVQQDGKMIGIGVADWDVNGALVSVTCNFKLSS